MIRIAQRELRNDVSAVLKRAEVGERFEITVAGRPVAELGPLTTERGGTPAERLRAIFEQSPVDGSWASDVAAMREEDRAAARDPWPE